MTVEERLAAMERRLEALEKENGELRTADARRKAEPVPKDPDAIREKIERELSPYHRMMIRQLALDVQRYGYDQAMIMHGRALPRRGSRATKSR